MTLFVKMAVGIALTLAAASAQAQSDLIVEKKTFELPAYTTAGGATIKGVKVGWESYGELNADRSNAILVTHFFSGTSHAAGKYKPTRTGRRAIGTRSSVPARRSIRTAISSSRRTRSSISARRTQTSSRPDRRRSTRRPASPTACAFPVVSIRDFVNVQKALLDSLGIRKLKAVVGASMGALQAYEWAVAYPDMVDRIVPVIGAAGGDAVSRRLGRGLGRADPPRSEVEGRRLRPARPAEGGPRGGPEGRRPCMPKGPNGRQRTSARRRPRKARIPPPRSRTGSSSKPRSMRRARPGPASPMPTTCSTSCAANQLAAADPAKIKAPALIVYTPTDQVFRQEWIERTAAAIKANGTPVETVDDRRPERPPQRRPPHRAGRREDRGVPGQVARLRGSAGSCRHRLAEPAACPVGSCANEATPKGPGSKGGGQSGWATEKAMSSDIGKSLPASRRRAPAFAASAALIVLFAGYAEPARALGIFESLFGIHSQRFEPSYGYYVPPPVRRRVIVKRPRPKSSSPACRRCARCPRCRRTPWCSRTRRSSPDC